MKFIADLRLLMAYAFKEDPHHQNAEAFFNSAEKEKAEIFVVTPIILEAEAVWLAQRVDVPLTEWLSFISDIITNPVLNKIEIDSNIYENHVKLYKKFGGNLTYFDSFHAAAAIATGNPLVTTDSKLLKAKEIPTKDLKMYTRTN